MFESRAVVERLRDPSHVRVRVVRVGSDGDARGKLLWTGNRPQPQPLTDEDYMREPERDEWLYLTPWDARAIYDALAEAYGHTVGDHRQTRADLEHERKRVDGLLDTVTKIALR